MASFGEKLKREREKRKISLDEIALSTKIGARMLNALEEDKFDQLPGGIFNKGFVRAYARHLGLDEEQTVADYLEAAGETPAPKLPEALPEVRIVPARDTGSATRKDLPWGWLAAGLLLLALVLSLWSYFRREVAEPNQHVNASPAVSPAATVPAQENVARPAPPAAAPSGQASGVSDTTTGPAGTFSVLLKAKDDSWISVVVDGQTAVADDVLAGGTEKTFQAKREIVIKAGNIGALEIFFNGTKLNRQGGEGEVKTLTFDGKGLAPSAKPSAPS